MNFIDYLGSDKAYLIKADGTEPIEIAPKNGADFQLKELYEHLGCSCIDILTLPYQRRIIVDDEGMLKDSPTINKNATLMMSAFTKSPYPYVIVGDVILCNTDQVK